MIAYYTGASGMTAFQEKLNVISHNIANVNTNGYKTQRISFEDLLYSRVNIHSNYNETVNQELVGETPSLVGHGVRSVGTSTMMDPASFDMTNYSLDFAINGTGFFALDRNGSVEYTRNGAFQIQMTGSRSGTLISADGSPVLDRTGKSISVTFDQQGNADLKDLPEKLGIYYFDNPYGLEATNGSSFLQTATSGEAKVMRGNAGEPEYELLQGVLENSAVDLGDQMVKVIEAQRAFQLSARIVQTADELQQTINNLR